MRKFVIHFIKETTTIIEVECEKISGLEDPSVLWLPSGEFKVKISAPKSILNKETNGTYSAISYYNHGIYDSYEEALKATEFLIRKSFELNAVKHNSSFSEEDIQAKLLTVQTIKL